MFPFDLNGLQFLIFYGVLALIVFGLLYGWQRRTEGQLPNQSLEDPLAIAYLSGGTVEAVRVACIPLLDRGMLVFAGERLTVNPKGETTLVRRPLERAILDRAQRKPVRPRDLACDREVARTADVYAAGLKRRGLLPNRWQLVERCGGYLLCVGALWIVAGIKLTAALEAGRATVPFLDYMAVLVAVLGAWVVLRRRTSLGDRLLDHLNRLFADGSAGAATHTPSGGANALMLAAIFGGFSLSAYAMQSSSNSHTKRKNDGGCGGGCSSGGGDGGGGCGGCGGCGGD